MFNTLSMAGTGGAGLVIEQTLKLLGFDFPEGAVGKALDGLTTFVFFVLLIWGQLRRKDLKWGMVRKWGV